MNAITPGAKFGRWTVVSDGGRNAAHQRYWHVRCECGSAKRVAEYAIVSGSSKSCGCYKSEKSSEAMFKHGLKRSRAYAVWSSMIQRCTDHKHKYFSDYGGRGIHVCDEWRDFRRFHADMSDPPFGLTLERIDNALGYSPKNCRWATRSEQANNRRSTRVLTLNGERRPLMEWAGLLNLNPYTIRTRLGRGASDEQALARTIEALAK